MKIFIYVGMFLTLIYSQKSKTADIELMIKASGDKTIFSDMAENYYTIHDFIIEGLEENKVTLMSDYLKKYFTEALIKTAVINEFEKSYNADYYKQCLEFYKLEKYKKILLAEEKSETDDEQKKLEFFLSEPKFELERQKIIDDLLVKTEIFANFWEDFFERPIYVQLVAKRKIFGGMSPTIIDIEEYAKKYSIDNSKNMKEFMFASIYFTYKDINLTDLKDYVNFLESNAGKWYSECLLLGSRNMYLSFMKANN
jgi:hypothetical protein